VGGSTGAKSVNEAVWSALPELLEKYNVIHLCGKGKSNPDMNGKTGYCQIEYCDK
jgi:UDP-N-acetylglucosamine--N-acetylmuramyl-(pentapeptide) pyrophosphoryl-undecaprenol N-acetylglucosamine transferase